METVRRRIQSQVAGAAAIGGGLSGRTSSTAVTSSPAVPRRSSTASQDMADTLRVGTPHGAAALRQHAAGDGALQHRSCSRERSCRSCPGCSVTGRTSTGRRTSRCAGEPDRGALAPVDHGEDLRGRRRRAAVVPALRQRHHANRSAHRGACLVAQGHRTASSRGSSTRTSWTSCGTSTTSRCTTTSCSTSSRLDSVDVIGHSFGGMVAAELAAHFPRRVEARPRCTGRLVERGLSDRRLLHGLPVRHGRPAVARLDVAGSGGGDDGDGARRRRGGCEVRRSADRDDAARASRARHAGQVHVAAAGQGPGPTPAPDHRADARRVGREGQARARPPTPTTS